MPTEELSITKLKSKIDTWKANKPKAGSHMPKPLWAAAGRLAKQYGVGPIAKRLELHPTRLRMHAGGKALDKVHKAKAGSSDQVRLVEVAPIQILAGDLPGSSLSSQTPTAVLTTSLGVSLNFYQPLDAQSIAALVRAAAGGV